jgi:transcriptional regulator with XRE-family HTH domain
MARHDPGPNMNVSSLRALVGGRLVWRTEARRLLREHLARTSQAELARLVGVGQSDIARWASGQTRPSSPEAFVALERVVGIPTSAWTTGPYVMHPCIASPATLSESAATAAQ